MRSISYLVDNNRSQFLINCRTISTINNEFCKFFHPFIRKSIFCHRVYSLIEGNLELEFDSTAATRNIELN